MQARLDAAGGAAPASAPASAPAAEQPHKKRRGTYAAPKRDYKPFRDGTRQAALFNLMVPPEGAMLAELTAAVPTWKATTVKSAFHSDFAALHGVGVKSAFDEAGVERFHAIVPEAAA